MSHALDGLRAIVEALVGPRLDRLALYPCTVVGQRASGGLDLQPDSARVPPCADVPIRHGLPGVTVTVPAGGRVLLGYEGGNPDLPYATLWGSGAATRITVNESSKRLARTDDEVDAGTLYLSATGTVVGYLAAGEPPLPQPPPPAPQWVLAVPLHGVVTGSSIVRA